MTKGYLGKTINKGPTPSVIIPRECSDIFNGREYYIIKKCGSSTVITPYSEEELAKELGRDVDEIKRVVDTGTELLTFRHIEVDLGE